MNGVEKKISSSYSIMDLLSSLNIETENIAIAINNEVIAKSDFKNYKIQSEDWVEIIQPLAGG